MKDFCGILLKSSIGGAIHGNFKRALPECTHQQIATFSSDFLSKARTFSMDFAISRSFSFFFAAQPCVKALLGHAVHGPDFMYQERFAFFIYLGQKIVGS